jgi:GT2 family glycosyltransferase
MGIKEGPNVQRGVSLVIATWNGRSLLEKFLPSVLEACLDYSGETEIIVVDDGSTDGTEEFCAMRFPSVRVVRLPQNQGYIHASNEGVRQTKNRLVILLNNDVLVRPDFLKYLPAHFDACDIFAARIRVFPLQDQEAIENGALKPETIWIRGVFRWGFIYVPALPSCPWDKEPRGRFSFSVGAGAFAVDRDKWLSLGGFDDLYQPFYCEETDLAYRALKRGWSIAYEPRSVVYHQEGHATISKARKSWFIRMIGERNRYFLVWKNISDPQYLVVSLLFIPFRLFRYLLRADLGSFFGFFAAFRHLRKVMARRAIEKRETKVSDRRIFDFFKL